MRVPYPQGEFFRVLTFYESIGQKKKPDGWAITSVCNY
jgi:hypothetical protein